MKKHIDAVKDWFLKSVDERNALEEKDPVFQDFTQALAHHLGADVICIYAESKEEGKGSTLVGYGEYENSNAPMGSLPVFNRTLASLIQRIRSKTPDETVIALEAVRREESKGMPRALAEAIADDMKGSNNEKLLKDLDDPLDDITK